MTFSAEIVPHLLFLRRYSAALSGSQAAGDALVEAMLEALIIDISILPSASSLRIALYALVSRFYASAAHRLPAWIPATGIGQNADIDVMALSPARRQALLLVAVEDFGMAEGAETLAMSEEEFAELLTSAYADVVNQMTSYESEISMCTLRNATTVGADGTPGQPMVQSGLATPAFA